MNLQWCLNYKGICCYFTIHTCTTSFNMFFYLNGIFWFRFWLAIFFVMKPNKFFTFTRERSHVNHSLYLKQCVEFIQWLKNVFQEMEIQFHFRVLQIACHSLHPAWLFHIIVADEVTFEGWPLLQGPLHTLLQAQPSGVAVLQDFCRLHICEYLKGLVLFFPLWTANKQNCYLDGEQACITDTNDPHACNVILNLRFCSLHILRLQKY